MAGCDRGEVTAYDIPKETPSAPVQPMGGTGMDPHAGMAMSQPSVTWSTLPDGWTQAAQSSGMRLASFSIAGEGNESAEMAIIPMGGFAGTEMQLVNMWRMQLGLPELVNTDQVGQAQDVKIGGLDGRLYEMAGKAQDVDTRIVVASTSKDGVNYFFKLIGNDAVVLAQKEAFQDFLKGVEFVSGGPVASTPPMVTPSSGAAEQRWQAPPDWQEQPATQFLLAKYQVPGEGGATATVTVSMLGGTAGGVLPNVNRWRGQLNLAPVDEAGLSALLSDIKAGSVEATLVEFEGKDMQSGEPARMLAVIVPLPSETWFFKMTGPTPVVQAKANEFRKFVNEARF